MTGQLLVQFKCLVVLPIFVILHVYFMIMCVLWQINNNNNDDDYPYDICRLCADCWNWLLYFMFCYPLRCL